MQAEWSDFNAGIDQVSFSECVSASGLSEILPGLIKSTSGTLVEFFYGLVNFHFPTFTKYKMHYPYLITYQLVIVQIGCCIRANVAHLKASDNTSKTKQNPQIDQNVYMYIII